MDRVRIELAPGWLPLGYVETERHHGRGGVLTSGERFGPQASRTFEHGDDRFWITDNPLRDTNLWERGEPLAIAGRSGVGRGGGRFYYLQLPWRDGQLLGVSVQRAPDARTLAIRIAESVRRAPPASVDIPLDCGDPLCEGPGGIEVWGSTDQWSASVGGPLATATLTHGRDHTPPPDARRIRPLTVDGRPATLWHYGLRQSTTLVIPLGTQRHLVIGSHARRPLREEEAERVATTVRIRGEPDYSWLGRRPD
jgi:hypothetical protein